MAFTFFMRDQPTLEHAADHMIPYASGRSRIKIWDAGCALGQETYTIAMIFAEKVTLLESEFRTSMKLPMTTSG